MDWTPSGKQLTPSFLGDLTPVEVLVDFEGPRSFLARDPSDQWLFLHQCGESENAWRYAVVPFTDDLVLALRQGRIDLSRALDQSRQWVVDIDPSGAITSCYVSNLKDIPSNCKPQPGTTLYPEHEPLFSLRATGPEVELGKARLSVLRDQIESARTGLRLLAEAAKGVFKSKGQPAKDVRQYFDLPAMLLPGSVQVSVYAPLESHQRHFEFDDTWAEMQQLLDAGLQQVAGDSDALDHLGSEEREAVLRAVYAFAPPARGAVTETEISGRLVRSSNGRVRIKRDTRARLNSELRAKPEPAPQLINQEGVITELDLEFGTCQLRDTNGATIAKLRFAHGFLESEQLFEDVKIAFDEGALVRTVAITFLPKDESLLIAVNPAELTD